MNAHSNNTLDRFALAPMVGVTTTHMRYLFRLISPNITLYTEMMSAASLLHAGSRCQRFLQFHQDEQPLVAQIAVADPKQAAEAAIQVVQAGFDAININVGCPSKAAQNMGCGALLMRHPDVVAGCVTAMQSVVSVPVSVKCRIGVDGDEGGDFLYRFLDAIYDAGCRSVTFHARKALLKGLNPKQNRHIPPIRYDTVYAVKQRYPDMHVVINGEIDSVASVKEHLHSVDGVMIGRAFERNPMLATAIDAAVFGTETRTKQAVLTDYIQYMLKQVDTTKRLNAVFLLKPLFGFCHGQRHAKSWRTLLTDMMRSNCIDTERLVVTAQSYALL